jgi:hypothetical protein
MNLNSPSYRQVFEQHSHPLETLEGAIRTLDLIATHSDGPIVTGQIGTGQIVTGQIVTGQIGTGQIVTGQIGARYEHLARQADLVALLHSGVLEMQDKS